jgi:CRISPR/Cas system-associated protein Cas5 (RAMP superfamily)
MKTITKFSGIIAIMAIIVAGLSACVSMSIVEESEEEFALRTKLENAFWKIDRLAEQPSLNGFENITKVAYPDSEWANRVESTYFSFNAGSNESERGRTVRRNMNGVESTATTLGMDANTWYRLTAPEMPGITYYYYRDSGVVLSFASVYKNVQ